MVRWFLALCGVVYGLGTAAAYAETLKMAVFLPPKSVGGSQVLTPIANDIKKDSGGKLIVKPYYGGQLGRSPFKQYKLVTDGIADMAYIVDIYTSGQFPDSSLFELPFNIHNATEGSMARWEMFKGGYLRGYNDVHVMGLWLSDPGGIHMKKPFKTLDDLKGLKIRASGKVATAFLNLIGAVPVAIPVTQVTEAIDRGVLDGLMQSWVGLVTFRTHNVVKYHYEAPVSYIAFSVVVNKNKWNKLSAENKALITKYGGASLASRAGIAFDKLGTKRFEEHRHDKDRTFIIPTKAQLAAAKARVKPLYDEWAKNNPRGKEKLEALDKFLEEIRKKG